MPCSGVLPSLEQELRPLPGVQLQGAARLPAGPTAPVPEARGRRIVQGAGVVVAGAPGRPPTVVGVGLLRTTSAVVGAVLVNRVNVEVGVAEGGARPLSRGYAASNRPSGGPRADCSSPHRTVRAAPPGSTTARTTMLPSQRGQASASTAKTRADARDMGRDSAGARRCDVPGVERDRAR
jgi:hypothetical protein